ncbi:hypothetical protein AAES_47049 [Amazona aestiva]|uniref:Uncharacterized protein n=1 Tax=Amazona aestiva TaxID=12930 RepID=A0A0Q3UTM4_AMAAE|nr:hypothetical protein AAES_47049 [Amazona aestiva]
MVAPGTSHRTHTHIMALRARPTAGLAWEKPFPGMGSAKEPEGLRLLSCQAGAEDACEPGAGSPGCPPVGGAAAFTFPKRELGSAAAPRLEASKKDAEMQASYPEVHVKGTVVEETPEPIREKHLEKQIEERQNVRRPRCCSRTGPAME